jgi:ADP-ribosyltransferase exoenzyme
VVGAVEVKDHGFDPAKHPRDRHGRWAHVAGGGGGDPVGHLESSVKRDLSRDERAAVMDYIGGGYRKLNRALRGGATLEADQQATTDALRKLGDEHALTSDMVLYRGIDRDATVAFGDIGQATGVEFTDRGFGSTTLSSDRAASWAGTLAQSRRGDSAVLQIRAPKGTPALPVEQLREGRSGIDQLHSRGRDTSGQWGSEEEIVLMPSTQLRVVSDSEQDGYRVIVAEVVH